MARILAFLTRVAAWRWTPCVGLAASSVLFVLLAIIVVPSKISLPGSSAPTTLDLPDQPNALTPTPPPRTPPLSTPPPRRPVMATPPAAAPPPAPAPEPPPPRPQPEETPPPPPPPPAAPPPAPANPETDDDQNEPAPAPAPTSRFNATPLRFLPQIGRAGLGPGGGAVPPPQPGAPPAQPPGPDDAPQR